jgi:hypothetical protein
MRGSCDTSAAPKAITTSEKANEATPFTRPHLPIQPLTITVPASATMLNGGVTVTREQTQRVPQSAVAVVPVTCSSIQLCDGGGGDGRDCKLDSLNSMNAHRRRDAALQPTLPTLPRVCAHLYARDMHLVVTVVAASACGQAARVEQACVVVRCALQQRGDCGGDDSFDDTYARVNCGGDAGISIATLTRTRAHLNPEALVHSNDDG